MILIKGTNKMNSRVERLFNSLNNEALDFIKELEDQDFQVTVLNMKEIDSPREYALSILHKFESLYETSKNISGLH